ncbi:N-acetylmuramic acid 6-phosphate etherase [Jeongeupia wiesaeckerbachi]|uniref:N-acetylmuramic acid 6-phosphate etherase n=1 Tax=Jeongeupia wiesaeckerbachi TaxID=3051218 RepID=UPI003D801C20
MAIDLSGMVTEQRNAASAAIDQMSTLQMLQVINQEDQQVAPAVARTLPEVARAVDVIVESLQDGGRLIYIGAGTSGRLGILDASECPPTYGTDPAQIVGLIAGGEQAVFSAVENAEDDEDAGRDDLKAIDFGARDVLVGIAASGRTPYVIGAIEYAKSRGATTVSLSCNPVSPMAALADIAITPVVGPEVVTGSSRMKAGTAQKLVLNMLTSGAMIRMGKVYGNLMVDVEATNAKLVERQVQIVKAASHCSRADAEQVLAQSGGHCKTAIVMQLAKAGVDEARRALAAARGHIREALNALRAA